MNRRVLVTGACGGIGSACAAAFLERDCSVAAVDLAGPAADSPLAGILSRSEAEFFAADISQEEECAGIADFLRGKFGGVDVLVNNAGIVTRSGTEATSLEDWNRVVSVNLTGTFLVTKALLPLLRESGQGRIVNLSSRAAGRPHRNAAPSYGATKAALVYLTRHWAREYGDAGILCFAVCPGPVASPMFEKLDPAYRAAVADEMAGKRPIRPEDVANIVVYAALDCPPSMTGQSFHCNGGTYWT